MYHQIAIVDDKGVVISNDKIDNNTRSINKFFKDYVDPDAKIVMESSSIWYNVYLQLEEKGYDVTLSNPVKTKMIASAKIKTDKIDAVTLAQLLRVGYIATCYVPPKDVMEYREITRHRQFVMFTRAKYKNKIHGILLQKGIKLKGVPFSLSNIAKLRKMKDIRIDGFLDLIIAHNTEIDKITTRIDRYVKFDEDASNLTTIPGIGIYAALMIVAEIGDIKRFPDSHKLCSYAGLVPSTHSSGGITKHGPITKLGSSHLRWILVQAIRVHVREHKDDTELSHFYYKMLKRKGMAKTTMAAASKLLRIIYWMLWDKRKYVASYAG